MNPLESLIGLSPVDSGSDRMYVNRMPNVNHELIEAIAESEEKSVDDPTGLTTIWQEVKDEAYSCLRSDLLSEMAKRANFREVVESSELPNYLSDGETFTPEADTMVGVVVTMPKSRYQSLFIRSLYVSFEKGSAPENLTIRIYDGNKGVQIGADIISEVGPDSFDFSVNVSVDCSKAGSKSVFIGALIPESSTVLSMGWPQSCGYTVSDLYSFDPLQTPLMSEMTEQSDCFVALEYEIRLSIDQVIAQFSERLRRVYAIMCGIGVIDRGLKSKKASRWTLVNRDAEKQNLEDLKADLKKELAGACRLIYGQVEQERLALVSRPDDQQGYFIGDYV